MPSGQYFFIPIAFFLIWAYLGLRPFLASYYWKKGLVYAMRATMPQLNRLPGYRKSGLTLNQYRTKLFKDSTVSFTKAISYLPYDGELYVGRGDSYSRWASRVRNEKERKELFIHARNDYLKGIGNFKDREVFSDLANVFVNLGNYKEAVKFFDKAVWYAPDFIEARNNYSFLLYSLAQKEKNESKKLELYSEAAVQTEAIIDAWMRRNISPQEKIVINLLALYENLLKSYKHIDKKKYEKLALKVSNYSLKVITYLLRLLKYHKIDVNSYERYLVAHMQVLRNTGLHKTVIAILDKTLQKAENMKNK
jgi:tetratricopeptide (TPR) repeat protein